MLTWMDSLRGRSLMRLASFTDAEMLDLVDLAGQIKARRHAGVRGVRAGGRGHNGRDGEAESFPNKCHPDIL